jgi:hypothetical protein
VAECLAQEVDRAALPGAAEYLRDRFLQPGVRVGDDQLDAREPALDERAQKAAPEGLGLRFADVERDHLAVAGLVHAVGEHQRVAHDAAAVSDLLDLGVEPEVGVAALERAVAERVDLLVPALADPRDLGLGDPQPERLDHLVDLAGGDAGDVGLLDDGNERLLTSPARLQEAREVAAPPDLRNRELDLARPRRPRPSSVPLRWASRSSGARSPRPAPTSSDTSVSISCWQTQLSDSRTKSSASPSSKYATTSSAVILFVSAIVVTPLVVVFAGLDESERHGGRTLTGSVRRSVTPI